MAHSATSASTQGAARPTGAEEPSIGALVQSAMADMSTLIRSEIELAKSEVGISVKRAGMGAGLFAAAGVVLAFSALFLLVALAEVLIALGLTRCLSYLLVWLLLVLVDAIAMFIGYRKMKKVEKPERTLETLRDLPVVLRRDTPGQRRRDVPTVTNGRVELRGSDQYTD